MSRTVYFADKSVSFIREASCGTDYDFILNDEKDMSRAKILKILETSNCIAVIAADPEQAFRIFASGFTAVEAAGGVVVNSCGECLMIFRNGRWDLPKGHVEVGESPEKAAVREVAEETGVCGAEVIRHLCDTLHSYCMHGRWELKRTHWYEMRGEANELAPQAEEGIEQAVWCAADEVCEHLDSSFPTIRRVMECIDKTSDLR